MDFTLSNEQRSWQMAARKFADEEIRPISSRATLSRPRARPSIGKSSRRAPGSASAPWRCRRNGRSGHRLCDAGAGDDELAKADSAISKAFSQNWKWSHLISYACTEDQKQRFLPAFVADDTFVLGKGITEPGAGSDNRMPGDDPKTGLKLKASARATSGSSTARRPSSPTRRSASCSSSTRAPTPRWHRRRAPPCSWCRATRRLPHRQGVQQERLALLPERRNDFENARVPHANLSARWAARRRRPAARAATPPAAICSATSSLRQRPRICDDACASALRYAKTEKQGARCYSRSRTSSFRSTRCSCSRKRCAAS